FADFARWHFLALPIHDPVLDAGKKGADRLVRDRVLRTDPRQPWRTLGYAVIVQQRDTELVLDPLLEIEVERSAGNRHDPQTAPLEPLDALDRLVFEQTLICGRHTEQARNPLLGEGMSQRGGIGLGYDMQRAAVHQRSYQQD